MASTLPTIAANPLTPAFELVRSVPAEVVAVALGALGGVALFALVVVVLWSRKPRGALQAAATDVVFIPPYPVAASGFASPPHVAARFVSSRPPAISSPPCSPDAGIGPGFVPSSMLSARVLAKMGYVVGDPGPVADGSAQQHEIEELEVLASSELHALETGAASALTPPASIPSAIETGPMSVVTVAATDHRPSSSIMASAPIADLDLDDAPTQLFER